MLPLLLRLRLHLEISRRLPCGLILLGCLLSTFAAPPAEAQQFVVDDAGLVELGAFQLEAWISPSAAWVLPAFTPLARMEITLGAGLVDEDDDSARTAEYVLQAKYELLPEAPATTGVSLVLGVGVGPFGQATGEQLDDLFAYLPLTYTLPDARARGHLNGGWTYDRGEERHRALYGVRGDLLLFEPLTVVGEIFGEGHDLGYQVGLRVALVPGLFQLDASYGDALSGDAPDIGFALGIAWTPPPLFTPAGGANARSARWR